MVAVVAGVVAMTMAARKIPVQIPRKVMGRGRVREGQKSFIPLRINSSGVMPIIFAQSIIIVPGTFARVHAATRLLQRLSRHASSRAAGCTTRCTRILILFFTYFYTAIIFNPVDLAENLKKQGAFIPGVKPGAKTAEYIDYVLEPHHAGRRVLPGGHRAAAVPDHRTRPACQGVLLRRHVAADRGRCCARHGAADAAALAAASLRRLHEEGPRTVPRPSALHVR